MTEPGPNDSETDDVSRRTFLTATGGVAAAAAIAGCTGDGGGQTTTTTTTTTSEGTTTGEDTTTTEETTTEPAAGGQLNLINATMSSLDPVAASDTASSEVTGQVFDGLVNYPNGGIPVESRLATDYEVSDDFLTYTFQIKEDAQFHNGDEVTASDFVFSYERLAGSENSQAAADILNAVGIEHETDDEGAYVPNSLATEAVDEKTLRFTIASPFHAAVQVLANNQFAAVPEGIVGDVEGYDGEMEYNEFASSSPVGAGPFEFETWKQGTEAAVVAFEDYHAEPPSLDRVHWQVIEDPGAMYNYAMNENADVFTIPTSRYDGEKLSVDRTDEKGRQRGTYGPLRNGKTAEFVGVPTLNIYYIGFNMQAVERPVRRAVAHAMNQHTVTDQVFKGRAIPAYHYTIPSLWPGGPEAANQHARENYPYGYDESQIDEARRVMEEAGYSENDRYQFRFTIYQSESWSQAAQILRDQLASAHIDMQIEQAPFSTLLERIRSASVDAFSLAWIVPWAAPDAFTKHLNPATSQTGEQVVEAFNNWPTDTEAAQRAIDAWEEIEANSQPTDDAEQVRNENYVVMEESNWTDVANLPVYHEIEQRFHYEHVDIEPFGVGGSYKQKYDDTSVNR